MNKDDVIHYMSDHYGPFHSQSLQLTSRKPTYGVSYPKLKDISNVIVKDNPIEFLESNDFSLYELEILQTMVIGSLRDVDQAIMYFKAFLTIAKEWSLIDSLCQRFVLAKKHPARIYDMLQSYQMSHDEYIERMICVVVLSHLLIDEYEERAMKLVQSCHHEGYYAKMAKAWAYCEYMIKYPDKALKLFESIHCDSWTHNKAIQKCIESTRISPELKKQLKMMKRY